MATGKIKMECSDVAEFDPDYIKTIVFTAIATTGLSTKSAEITGLCFIAIDKAHLKEKDLRGSILKKLSITCKPKKTQIDPEASKKSDLKNNDLLDCPTFDEQARMVVDFLKNLPKPIRLVAHKGDDFHFRLLFLHLKQTIPVSEFQGLFCTDSLKVAREMYPDLESHSLNKWYKQRTGKEPIVGAEGRCQMLLEIVRSFKDKELEENVRSFKDKELEEFFTLCGRIKCMFSDTQFNEKKGQSYVDEGEMGKM